jgi:alpha-L-rhamnosidase
VNERPGGAAARATGLRLDHGAEPLGVTERAPRLSWLLPDGATAQHAYQIEATGWDSGRVESSASTYVPYSGPPLRSRQRVEWRVKVWTDVGEAEWSEPAWWETGLLDPDDWQARFVSPVEGEVPPAGRRPAHLLRRSFDLPSRPLRARAHATAHGIYELFVNGARVGDHELAPGFSAYRRHLEVQAHDVAPMLRPGTNQVCAVLSDGWYRGQVGFIREHDSYGHRLAFLAQVEVELGDGTSVTVGTDGRWESATGPIVAADLIEGQHVDLRAEPTAWTAVEVGDQVLGRLTSSPAPPIRRIEEVTPASVTELAPGHHVVDLGQNINGWLRLANLGPAGTLTRLTHGEHLGPDGDVDMANLVPRHFRTGEPLSAGQVDEVVAAGTAGKVFEPRHTTHGFRYARIEGHPGPLGPADLRGVVVHTDLRRTGWFTCSDPRINALHKAAVWSFRDNACGIPTDCPQRERAGWTGDWQVYAPTGAFLYDVAGFSARWLRDLAADQWPDGRVPNYIPDPAGPAAFEHPVARWITGSAGWGDAAVLVPWEMWQAYGDERFLTRQYDSAVAWVTFAEEAARTGRHPSRAAARPEPAPHETYLWDSGFHWGEWCEPGSDTGPVFTREADMADVATAYLHRSASVLATIAELLGKDGDAARWSSLAAHALDAWRAEFVAGDGSIRPDTQANLVRALAFGLIPDELRAPAADRLVELIRKADRHLGTGFLATPYLLPVLADAGHADVAFELLFQDTSPSWLAMIDRGATTIWESWEGVDAADGVGSLNHFSKGAVVTFLHRYVGGIRPDPDVPAYRRFRIQPLPGGGITSAEAVLDSPYGRIRSAWSLDGGRIALDVTVPPGTEATVRLPDGSARPAAPGSHTFTAEVGP